MLESILLNNDEDNSEHSKQNSNENKTLGKLCCCISIDNCCLWWFFHNSFNINEKEELHNNVYCKCLKCCNDCLELRFNKIYNKEITFYCCCTLYYIN